MQLRLVKAHQMVQVVVIGGRAVIIEDLDEAVDQEIQIKNQKKGIERPRAEASDIKAVE